MSDFSDTSITELAANIATHLNECGINVVKDRLAVYIHWKDNQSLIQATAIILKHQLDPFGLKGFCLREGDETQFQQLVELHHEAVQAESVSMQSLEKMLTKLLIRNLS